LEGSLEYFSRYINTKIVIPLTQSITKKPLKVYNITNKNN